MSIRILALDTATEACSAALMIDGTILSRFAVAPREHTHRILPMVNSLLEEAGISLLNLGALAFSRGPGSFTGIRIGIGIAQGLALGSDLPIIDISTLAVLAEGAWRQIGAHQVLTAIDARKGRVYLAQYYRQENGVWKGEEAERVIKAEGLLELTNTLTGQWACAGAFWQTYPIFSSNECLSLIDAQMAFPTARDMLPLALQKWCIGDAMSVEQAKAVYLCPSEAWKKLPGRG